MPKHFAGVPMAPRTIRVDCRQIDFMKLSERRYAGVPKVSAPKSPPCRLPRKHVNARFRHIEGTSSFAVRHYYQQSDRTQYHHIIHNPLAARSIVGMKGHFGDLTPPFEIVFERR